MDRYILRLLTLFSTVGAVFLCSCPPYDSISPDCKLDMPTGQPMPDIKEDRSGHCAAALGLPGDNALCVDFKDYADKQDFTNKAIGGPWDFRNLNCPMPEWEIRNSTLHLPDPGTLQNAECIFTLPDLTQKLGNYSQILISVQHKVELIPGQRIQVLNSMAIDSTNLIDETRGRQPRKRWIHIIDKNDLTPMTPLRFIFRFLGSNNPGGAWNIESIAVNGIL